MGDQHRTEEQVLHDASWIRRRNVLYLTNQSVKIDIGRSFNTQTSSGDVEDGFVINHEIAFGKFKGVMNCQHGIIRFYDGR